MKKRFAAIIWLMFLPIFCFADTPPAAANDTPEALTTTKPLAPVEAKQVSPSDINCQYKLSKDTDTVEQTLISTWAENAAVQSFQFNPTNLKTELDALKNCYTSQGWKAFNEALKTSGNLEAIRESQLTVTSQINGTAKIKNIKEKQWKVSIPLKVTYQNKEKQLLQALNVELLITLSKSGSFGIMQVIAVPKQASS
ncbi:MAG: DotI/IcmL family type IV secretion protein [Gammaproteobacteria bacterium]|nr:DotI/IcmL family type IV secretion protein [Gammaproteobacteria bacterium]